MRISLINALFDSNVKNNRKTTNLCENLKNKSRHVLLGSEKEIFFFSKNKRRRIYTYKSMHEMEIISPHVLIYF